MFVGIAIIVSFIFFPVSMKFHSANSSLEFYRSFITFL
jgi:hypothetical protein